MIFPKLNRNASLLLASILTAALLTGCASSSHTAGNEPSTPEFSAVFSDMNTSTLDGNAVDKSLFADKKMTLINVWNIGCAPCLNELPILEQISQDYADKGVGIVGLHYNYPYSSSFTAEAKQQITSILSEAGVTYPQIVPSQDMVNSREFQNLTAYPTTFFVDADGKILDYVMRANDYDGWKDSIEAHLPLVTDHD